jgi:hypothetical protein
MSKVVHTDLLEPELTLPFQDYLVSLGRTSACCPPSLVVHPAHAVSLSVAILVRATSFSTSTRGSPFFVTDPGSTNTELPRMFKVIAW